MHLIVVACPLSSYALDNTYKHHIVIIITEYTHTASKMYVMKGIHGSYPGIIAIPKINVIFLFYYA